MTRTFLYVLAVLFFNISLGQNTSSVDFIIRNLGVNVDGHFENFSISTEFNSDGELEALLGTIKVKSIKTGIESRDEHLLKEDYFNESKYKDIEFQSTSIQKISKNKYKAQVNLKIKGKTKRIMIPVEVIESLQHYKILSNFEINRKDFDVGGGSLVMSKTVKVNVVHYQKL